MLVQRARGGVEWPPFDEVLDLALERPLTPAAVAEGIEEAAREARDQFERDYILKALAAQIERVTSFGNAVASAVAARNVRLRDAKNRRVEVIESLLLDDRCHLDSAVSGQQFVIGLRGTLSPVDFALIRFRFLE